MPAATRTIRWWRRTNGASHGSESARGRGSTIREHGWHEEQGQRPAEQHADADQPSQLLKCGKIDPGQPEKGRCRRQTAEQHTGPGSREAADCRRWLVSRLDLLEIACVHQHQTIDA